jgi:hypothetical protein
MQSRLSLSAHFFASCLLGIIILCFCLKVWISDQEAPAPIVFITEFQAINTGTLADADGDYPDWIEIRNLGTQTINLKDWSLTDDFKNLRRWRFPELKLRPGDYQIIFASGKDDVMTEEELHTNFSLDPNGEYLALVLPDGKTISHEYFPKYPRQYPGISYGVSQTKLLNDTSSYEAAKHAQFYFRTPTPNSESKPDALWGRVADTKFSHDRGFYEGAMEVSITSKTSQALIYYTTDGSIPDEQNGQLYREPILIDTTTILRAAAYRPDLVPTDVDTHSYIFPASLWRQNGAGFPMMWNEAPEPIPADYEMDQEILSDPAYREQLLKALYSLPTCSIVMQQDDLFGTADGIYCHPTNTGGLWERPASFELFFPDQRPALHINCGVRIQGGLSRIPKESPKHSLRLCFRDRYGASNLSFPLFSKSSSGPFNSLVLRAGYNHSWLHSSSVQRLRGDYLRDQWVRDTLRAMEYPSAQGRFVHLFLNGLYWGVYNLCERPSSAFLARQYGGRREDYDARNDSTVLEGDSLMWNELFRLAQDEPVHTATYASIADLLDLPQFCDFMLTQFYCGAGNSENGGNWYAGRPRHPQGKFRFYSWDSECALTDPTANLIAQDHERGPYGLFQCLRKHATFCRLFAACAQRHCAIGGALSPSMAARRYQKLAVQVESALILESARWGDYRKDVDTHQTPPFELYTVNDHWRPEVKRLLEEYFPQRAKILLEQLKHAKLTIPAGESRQLGEF